MRNCNQYIYIYIYIFFIEKICFKSEERTAKKGRFLRLFQQIIFLKKLVKQVFLEIYQNSQENTYGRVSFSIKSQVLGLRPATILKKRLWCRCFPVSFAKFRRTPFFIEHFRWLLLTIEFLKIVFSSMGSPNLQI